MREKKKHYEQHNRVVTCDCNKKNKTETETIKLVNFCRNEKYV